VKMPSASLLFPACPNSAYSPYPLPQLSVAFRRSGSNPALRILDLNTVGHRFPPTREREAKSSQ
jgi:hypothetical protein